MNQYFYLTSSNEQKGPVDGNRLLEYGVTRTTSVWREGMEQWLPAGQVPELAGLFVNMGPTPPPHASASTGFVPPLQNDTKRSKPDNLLVWAILCTALCCLPTGVAAIVYSNKVDVLWNEGKYDEAEKAANNTKIYCFVSLGLGLLAAVVGFVIGFISAYM